MDALSSKKVIAGTLRDGVVENLVSNYMQSLSPEEMAPLIESEAIDLLGKIMAALEDESLDDPECIQQIDAIVKAYGEKGVYISRHDW